MWRVRLWRLWAEMDGQSVWEGGKRVYKGPVREGGTEVWWDQYLSILFLLRSIDRSVGHQFFGGLRWYFSSFFDFSVLVSFAVFRNHISRLFTPSLSPSFDSTSIALSYPQSAALVMHHRAFLTACLLGAASWAAATTPTCTSKSTVMDATTSEKPALFDPEQVCCYLPLQVQACSTGIAGTLTLPIVL